MTPLDRFIQSWRIRKAKPYIQPGSRLLDIGASDAPLFKSVSHVGTYVGVDPDLGTGRQLAPNARLVKGFFPDCIQGEAPFDCITMLAVLEHIPLEMQPKMAADCAAYLKSGGYLVVTAPSPFVDRILAVLKTLRLIHGMALEEHYGYDVNATPQLFSTAGFQLIRKSRFQLGLNNLFIFTKE